MRTLVKIKDLVNLGELPLGGLSVSMSAGQMWNDEIELDMGKEQEPNAHGGQDRAGEENIDLG